METDNVVVGFSDSGKGLFAKKDFRQGETIVNLPTDGSYDEPDMYSIQISPGVHLNCSNHPIGSTNHSCEPNAAIRGFRLVAWSCIKAGEEITLDYKITEENLAAPFDCLCKSKKCRGRIE